MKNDKLKERVLAILDKTDQGKAVNVEMTSGGNSQQLRVTRTSATKAIAPAGNAMTAGAPAAEMFALDLPQPDEETIISKITAASAAGAAAPTPGLPEVVLTRDDVKKVWIVFSDCSYQPENILPPCTVTVPKGFETDLSSIPRPLWSIIEPAELSLAAPLFHDMIYECGGKVPDPQLAPPGSHVFTRAEVDAVFLELMTKAGIPKWKRMAGYWAVRAFAGFAWKN